MKQFLVTATPPTTNGDLHVGHLSGPYLAADVFVRYQKMQGHRVVYLCSGDDHQSYIVTTARSRGQTPEQLVRHYNQAIPLTLQAMNIELDVYTSPLSNTDHIDFVQNFFRELYDQGLLKEKTTKIPYCEECSRYLFESFIKGKCPFCGADASGNLCEECGHVNNPTELREPVCSICNTQPSLVEYKGLFFPLENYRALLAEFYSSRISWRPHLRALCDNLISQPLPDYPATYPTDWGIPVPVDGFPGQVINVWLEMYPGHIATTRTWGKLEGHLTLADQLWASEAVLVQFLGYDNSFFNAVLHVALSLALEGQYVLPEHIITNEFYLLDREKFSTSRNHAVWGRDILQKVQADELRYYLSRTNPEHMQTNFSYQKFAKLVNEEMFIVWSKTINGLLECVQSEFGGFIPAESDLDLQVLGLLGWAKMWLERFYDADEFSLRQASAVLQAYVEGCADYLDRIVRPTPKKKSREYIRRVASLAYLVRGLAYFAAPLMPTFAQELWVTLGLAGQVGQQRWSQSEHPFQNSSQVGAVQQWFLPVENELESV